MTIRKPAEVFPPGEFLKEELEERGWSQADLAEVLGRHLNTINDVVTGKRRISPEFASDLATALGTSPDLWMNLDSSYQLARVRRNDDDISQRAKLYGKAPVKELVRRGWIESSPRLEVLETRVLKFLNIDSLEDEPEIPLHAARKATSYDKSLTTSQVAWLLRARQLADTVKVGNYSNSNFRTAIARLRELCHVPQEARHAAQILGEAGIKLLVIQPLPGTRIDGACFWIGSTPVIVLSLRFDRLDNFWFVLFHELGHVLKGDMSLDLDMELPKLTNGRLGTEREADEFAAETLIPRAQLDNFVARIRPLYSIRRIAAFAYTVGVHPSIVVGQLQNRGEIPFTSFRKAMTPIRQWVVQSTTTDGWGAELPADLGRSYVIHGG